MEIDYANPKSIAYSNLPLPDRKYYLKNFKDDTEKKIKKLEKKKNEKISPQFKLLVFILLSLLSQNLVFMIFLLIIYKMIKAFYTILSDPKKPDTKSKRDQLKDLKSQRDEADKYIKNLSSVL